MDNSLPENPWPASEYISPEEALVEVSLTHDDIGQVDLQRWRQLYGEGGHSEDTYLLPSCSPYVQLLPGLNGQAMCFGPPLGDHSNCSSGINHHVAPGRLGFLTRGLRLGCGDGDFDVGLVGWGRGSYRGGSEPSPGSATNLLNGRRACREVLSVLAFPPFGFRPRGRLSVHDSVNLVFNLLS